MDWWKAMQPAFRESADPLPKEIYTIDDIKAPGEDIWASLRKGGPNGFVSLMMLLIW